MGEARPAEPPTKVEGTVPSSWLLAEKAARQRAEAERNTAYDQKAMLHDSLEAARAECGRLREQLDAARESNKALLAHRATIQGVVSRAERAERQLDAAESDLARAEQSKLALAQMWHDQTGALKRALEVVAKYHRWLERVEAHRIPGAYMGLDHAVGENVDGCSGCAALGVVGPPPDLGGALGQTASETRGGES